LRLIALFAPCAIAILAVPILLLLCPIPVLIPPIAILLLHAIAILVPPIPILLLCTIPVLLIAISALLPGFLRAAPIRLPIVGLLAISILVFVAVRLVLPVGLVLFPGFFLRSRFLFVLVVLALHRESGGPEKQRQGRGAYQQLHCVYPPEFAFPQHPGLGRDI
jgi:hypothetical protein